MQESIDITFLLLPLLFAGEGIFLNGMFVMAGLARLTSWFSGWEKWLGGQAGRRLQAALMSVCPTLSILPALPR